MRVRRWLGAAVTLLATASLVDPGIEQVHAQAPPERPNILIIITDDQRGNMKAMPVTTDLFRRQGVAYRNAFVTTPLCCPSRSSIMTGHYAHNHGVTSNMSGSALDDVMLRRGTIQARLKDNKYTTAVFGKFMNAWPRDVDPPDFDTWATGHRSYYGSTWNLNGTVATLPDYHTTFVGDRAVEFVAGNQKAPWLMYMGFRAPHSNFTPEPAYEDAPVGSWPGNPAVGERDRSDKPPHVREKHAGLADGRRVRAAQMRALMSVDDQVERVFEALRRTGQLNNTFAFFISDNGYLWGEHGLMAKDHPYTASVGVKMYARWPGRIAAGSRDRRTVANIDIAPTVVAAAGVDAAGMDGRNLLEPSWSRDRLLLEHWCNRNKCNRWASTRTKSYQYIEYYNAGGNQFFREYYDLQRDPWQLTNRFRDGVPSNIPDRGALRAQLQADRTCSERSCP